MMWQWQGPQQTSLAAAALGRSANPDRPCCIGGKQRRSCACCLDQMTLENSVKIVASRCLGSTSMPSRAGCVQVVAGLGQPWPSSQRSSTVWSASMCRLSGMGCTGCCASACGPAAAGGNRAEHGVWVPNRSFMAVTCSIAGWSWLGMIVDRGARITLFDLPAAMSWLRLLARSSQSKNTGNSCAPRSPYYAVR
jgi:hypothetical protein